MSECNNNHNYSTDEDNNILSLPPTSLVQCINPDGTINILKLYMYRLNRQKQLLQNTYNIQEMNDIMDNGILDNLIENDNNIVDRRRSRNNRQPTKRSEFRYYRFNISQNVLMVCNIRVCPSDSLPEVSRQILSTLSLLL
jgi:hypothetical protein